MTMAQDAYASALAERDELRGPGGVRREGGGPTRLARFGPVAADLAELRGAPARRSTMNRPTSSGPRPRGGLPGLPRQRAAAPPTPDGGGDR